jgi:HSP20 family protein
MEKITMNIIRTEPWNWMDRIHQDLDRLAATRALAGDEPNTASDWVPAVDVTESNDDFVIRADLPGVDANDVEVTMDKGVLAIQGARETRSETEVDGYQRTERASGRFLRRFTLPDTTDSEAIAANAKDGVLEIRIPKKLQVQPQRIKVKS